MNILTPIFLSLTCQLALAQVFRDVTPSTFDPPNLKFGGPAIADLDGNGFPDLILGYHGGAPIEVYFNFAGEFVRSSFKQGGDMHGYVPFRASPDDRGMHFTVSRGGSRGTAPRSPVMYRIDADTQIFNVTDESGIPARIGRGRSALYLDMSLNPGQSIPDVIYTNSRITKCPLCDLPRQHTFANLGNHRFTPRDVQGLTSALHSEATVVDIDGDGIMEIIMFAPGIEIFKLTAPYTVRNITTEVLPKSLFKERIRIASIAELDFDNDGDFDLYIAIGRTGSRARPNSGRVGDDILLENRNGVFVDVSDRARIPKGTYSFGVTAADFNNDGFMDIFVTVYDEPDILLRNRGDGTFRTVRSRIDRPTFSRGDMAQAVDYDGDGRVDLIVSQGERSLEQYPGMYRVFRNFLKGGFREGSVLVRVGSSPRRLAVSLHAVVTVSTGTRTWIRRVGTPGVSISASYIELVHVGIGSAAVVDVKVRWVNGEEMNVDGVTRGSRIEVGTFGRRGAARRGRALRRRRLTVR